MRGLALAAHDVEDEAEDVRRRVGADGEEVALGDRAVLGQEGEVGAGGGGGVQGERRDGDGGEGLLESCDGEVERERRLALQLLALLEAHAGEEAVGVHEGHAAVVGEADVVLEGAGGDDVQVEGGGGAGEVEEGDGVQDVLLGGARLVGESQEVGLTHVETRDAREELGAVGANHPVVAVRDRGGGDVGVVRGLGEEGDVAALEVAGDEGILGLPLLAQLLGLGVGGRELEERLRSEVGVERGVVERDLLELEAVAALGLVVADGDAHVDDCELRDEVDVIREDVLRPGLLA